jgi:excisionase family DNA binding protein
LTTPTNETPSLEQETILLTIDEACRRLRISRWSLYQLIQRRQLATIHIGRRRLVPERAIQAFIERHLEEAR